MSSLKSELIRVVENSGSLLVTEIFDAIRVPPSTLVDCIISLAEINVLRVADGRVAVVNNRTVRKSERREPAPSLNINEVFVPDDVCSMFNMKEAR